MNDLIFLTYEDVRDYLATELPDYGYGTPDRPTPTFTDQLPDSDGLKVSPDAVVFLSVGGGAGLSKDGAFDRTFITVRVAGPQNDQSEARRLAMAVDRALLSFSGSGDLGGVYSLGIGRTGGAPALLLKDNAERYHFTGSYITEHDSGL